MKTGVFFIATDKKYQQQGLPLLSQAQIVICLPCWLVFPMVRLVVRMKETRRLTIANFIQWKRDTLGLVHQYSSPKVDRASELFYAIWCSVAHSLLHNPCLDLTVLYTSNCRWSIWATDDNDFIFLHYSNVSREYKYHVHVSSTCECEK